MQPLQFNNSEQRTRNFTYSPHSSSCSNHLPSKCDNIVPKTLSDDDNQQRSLRFDIVLEAATAITQKTEETTITYLNKGQTYGIQLTDKQASNVMITSTLSIDFHLVSHRIIAENYWKFWITQQKLPDARAIEIDASQSAGIADIEFPSFNKITFKWNGRYGAKLLVRFKCLSTDFSRIKGVKGIPLRAQMNSQIDYNGSPSFDETCYCRVKLFRDKGAERKNKDDAKQISKQLEKVYGKANNESLPLMYNTSLPYSVFSEVPVTTENAEEQPARNHTRVKTAPNSLFHGKTSSHLYSPPLSTYSVGDVSSPATTVTTPVKNTFPLETSDDFSFLEQQDMLLPYIDTNLLLVKEASELEPFDDLFSSQLSALDDDLPPLTADTGTIQMSSTTFLDMNSMLTPDLILDNSSHFLFTSQLPPPPTSIYDIFTPEEIQQATETNTIPLQDYFCDNNSKITQLQQQLQLHTKNAYDIVLHSDTMSNMYSSLPVSGKKRSRTNRLTNDDRVKKHRTF